MFPWHKKLCGCKHNLRLRDFLRTPFWISQLIYVPLLSICSRHGLFPQTFQLFKFVVRHGKYMWAIFSWSVLGGRQKWPWKFTFSPYYTMIMMQSRTKNHVILQALDIDGIAHRRDQLTISKHDRFSMKSFWLLHEKWTCESLTLSENLRVEMRKAFVCQKKCVWCRKQNEKSSTFN